MKSMGITELRKKLTMILEGNEIIEITRYGKPLAILVPKNHKLFSIIHKGNTCTG